MWHAILSCREQQDPTGDHRAASDSMPHIVESDAADAAEPQMDMIFIDEHE